MHFTRIRTKVKHKYEGKPGTPWQNRGRPLDLTNGALRQAKGVRRRAQGKGGKK